MTADYWFIDHRAARYLPRPDPLLAGFPIVLATATVALLPIVLGIIALNGGGPIVTACALLALAFLLVWTRQLRRYVIRIPDHERLSGYYIAPHLASMQRALREHPDLRDVIEPALIASYAHARAGRVEPIATRATAVQELVADVELDQVSGSGDADVADLRRWLEVRRQMRRDGLL